ncbi:hypothetical protein I4300191C4_10690 [Solibaculum mannosilyticum]
MHTANGTFTSAKIMGKDMDAELKEILTKILFQLNQIDKRFDDVDKHFDSLTSRVDSLSEQQDSISGQMKSFDVKEKAVVSFTILPLFL